MRRRGLELSLALRGVRLSTSGLGTLPLNAFSFRSQLGERARDELVGRMELFQAREGRLVTSVVELVARILHRFAGGLFMLCLAPKDVQPLVEWAELCGTLEFLVCDRERPFGRVQLQPPEEFFDTGLFGEDLSSALRGLRLAAIDFCTLLLEAFSFRSQLGERA